MRDPRAAEHGPGGWCDLKRKQIVVGAGLANGQVRTLVHEIAHALGIGYAQYGREQARGGRQVTLPCCKVCRLRDGSVAEYCSYIDITPVYA